MMLLIVFSLVACGEEDPPATPETYTVTFADYSGRILGKADAQKGEVAIAPVTPTREGYTFTGWSPSLESLTNSETVVAQYELIGGENMFDISYVLNGNTVTATFAMRGSVNFCGMEGIVTMPSDVEVISVTSSQGMVGNCKDGKIYFMFASPNGKNITEDTVLMTVRLNYTGSADTFKLETAISDLYDQSFETMTHTVIGETIAVK